jgi:hypothetical protein
MPDNSNAVIPGLYAFIKHRCGLWYVIYPSPKRPALAGLRATFKHFSLLPYPDPLSESLTIPTA